MDSQWVIQERKIDKLTALITSLSAVLEDSRVVAPHPVVSAKLSTPPIPTS